MGEEEWADRLERAQVSTFDGELLVPSSVKELIDDLREKAEEEHQLRLVAHDRADRLERQIRALRRDADSQLRASIYYADAIEVLEFWRDRLHPTAVSLGGERLKKVISCLTPTPESKGYTVEQLKEVVDGYEAYQYVLEGRGRVRHGTPATRRIDAELLFRDAQHVDQGRAFAREVSRRQETIPQAVIDPASQQLAEMGQAALALANFGWNVFPISPRAKTPATIHGLNDATRDVIKITKFWLRYPEHNIGVRCGVESGILVLDVDDRHGGNESLAELELANEKLPLTLSVKTPGGGQHFYFAHPGGDIRNTTGYPATGLDIRGDGGYVLAPPSVSEEGRRYEVDERVPIADLPRWLREKLVHYQTALKSMSTQQWVDEIMRDVPEGGRNDALTKLTGKYISEGLSEELILPTVWAQNVAHCHPPVSAKECKSVVQSILRRDARNRNAVHQLGSEPSNA
jgi:hypothetical protein